MALQRQWTTPLVAGSFLLMGATGILMFFHWDTGLNKTVHEWLGIGRGRSFAHQCEFPRF